MREPVEPSPELEAAQDAAMKAFNPHARVDNTNWPGWEPSESRKLTGEPMTFGDLTWEMDDLGMHRLIDAEGRGGEWSMYEHPAATPEGDYIIFTAYYEGSLPIEVPIAITPAPKQKDPNR